MKAAFNTERNEYLINKALILPLILKTWYLYRYQPFSKPAESVPTQLSLFWLTGALKWDSFLNCNWFSWWLLGDIIAEMTNSTAHKDYVWTSSGIFQRSFSTQRILRMSVRLHLVSDIRAQEANCQRLHPLVYMRVFVL